MLLIRDKCVKMCPKENSSFQHHLRLSGSRPIVSMGYSFCFRTAKTDRRNTCYGDAMLKIILSSLESIPKSWLQTFLKGSDISF